MFWYDSIVIHFVTGNVMLLTLFFLAQDSINWLRQYLLSCVCWDLLCFMESPIRIFMQLYKHSSRWLETELPLGSECCIRQWHSWLPPSRPDSYLLNYLCCLMYFLTDNEMLQSCICLLQSFPFVCYQQAQTCSILHCQLRLHGTTTLRVSRHFCFLHYCIPCNFGKWCVL